LLSVGLFDKAFDAYSKAVELNPMAYDAFAGRAILHLKQGNIDKAIADHKAAILHAPDLVIKSQLLNMKEFKFSLWLRLRIFLNRILSIVFRSLGQHNQSD